MPDHSREQFATLAGLRLRRPLKIAVLDVPEWKARLHSLLPDARISSVASIGDFIAAPAGTYDAMYTGYERGTAYSLLHPVLTTVIPDPGLGSVPLAFTVPRGEADLLQLANAWLEQEQASGLVDQKLQYWVYGHGVKADRVPRWSVMHDVLGW